jgi:hypothetical protein
MSELISGTLIKLTNYVLKLCYLYFTPLMKEMWSKPAIPVRTNARKMPKQRTAPAYRYRALLLRSYHTAALILLTQFFFIRIGYSQDSLPAKPNNVRLWTATAGHAALWAGSFVVLNKAWYEDYPRSSFHFFNDKKEWNQVDKTGHAWTAYQLARVSGAVWKWTGLSQKKSAWLGGASAFAYQSIIEILDGFSEEWGFSWGDMEANLIGSAGFVAQELLWKEQRIQLKMSYWPYRYPGDAAIRARRNSLFGAGTAERILKDYNSQTYWVSANIKSFLPEWNIPKWLNISFGYSSDIMLGGFENKWTDKNGISYDRTDLKRTRRWYLSPDIDLTRIRTRSRFLRSVFYVVSMVKVPAPALQLNSRGRLQLHALYF